MVGLGWVGLGVVFWSGRAGIRSWWGWILLAQVLGGTRIPPRQRPLRPTRHYLATVFGMGRKFVCATRVLALLPKAIIIVGCY